MTNLKPIIAISFALLGSYCVVLHKGNPLADPRSKTCMSKRLNSFLPWDSGCFYSAFFEKEPSLQQIEYEHEKLSRFVDNGGIVQHVLWYRSVFYQRFRSHFDISYEDLDQMHKRFTESNPTRAASQIHYLSYLSTAGEKNRGQEILDHYCRVYIPRNFVNEVNNIGEMMALANLDYSMETCFDKVKVSN